MKEKNFIVNQESTLIEFLRNQGYSKNKVKSLLKYENIKVNGKVVQRGDLKVKGKDQIIVSNQKKVRPPFPILYEDQEFLVIHKPSKILTVSDYSKEKNAYSLLKKYLEEKGSHEKLYVVHRIDKDTSGIVVFCKNQKLTSLLQKDWQSLVKKRHYVAVLEGSFLQKVGTLCFYLQENKEKCVIITDKEHGKKAITNYKITKQNKLYSLAEIDIETGRKNQIRASFAHIVHPVAGDKKYYAKTNPIGRVALHHKTFAFVHPITKKLYSFDTEIPKSFLALVK